MPKLNIEDFETPPQVGQTVRVEGKVKSIDEDSGEVDVSYDKIEITEGSDNESDEGSEDSEESGDLSLDAALKKNFQATT